ncbi:MAG: hypothetical protein WCS73_02420 [Lentisphaeria bacterium]
MSNDLLIGWGEVDITPKTDKFISLNGQYYERLTKKIHSRLKLTAVAFSSGKEHFLTASMDNVGMDQKFHDLIRKEVVKMEPEINPKNIFINAIHSHSAPSAKVQVKKNAAWRDQKHDDVLSANEYIEFVTPLVTRAFVDAWHSRQPGGIASALGSARVGHCRRAVYSTGKAEMYGDTTRRDFIGMEAGEDSGVEMLFTYNAEGKRTGMLLNVACPSQTMESTYQISSDFAGATRELLKEEYGEDFHTIYQISPAGCQSPRDLVRHYTTGPDFWHADGVACIADRLLNAVRAAKTNAIDYAPKFVVKSQLVTLPRRRASYEDYVNTKAELARLIAIQPEKEAFEAFCAETHANEKIDGHGPYDSKLHHFVQIKNAQAVLYRYEDQDEMPNIHFDMSVVRLGDLAIATNPFELYLYYGQNIKARSLAKQTFLVQLAIGADIPVGYLPSPEAEKFGGYGGCIINGEVGSDGGYKLADTTVEAINELFK